MTSNFALMADYNQWMNNNIYRAASQLRAKELCEDRGAFFGSILDTLNHILVGDTVWLKRFADHPANLQSLEYVRSISKPTSLDEILYAEFQELAQARQKMDRTILDFADELNDQLLATQLSYRDTKGNPYTQNLGQLLQHFFNHQTHHRGQVSTLLNQLGIDIGTTDLLVNIADV